MEHRPTSSLRRPSVIAQHSTPAPIDDVVNNDEAERLRNRMLIADDSSECINVNSETYIIINNQFIPGMRKIVEYMMKKNYERITPAAPIDDVVHDDETQRLRSRGLPDLTRKTHLRDDIAESIKLNTQNKMNIKNTTRLESSPLRPRSVIAQGSTPAPINDVDNDDETKRSRSGESLGLSAGGIAKRRKLNTQNEINIKNTTQLESSSLRSRSAIAQGSTPAPISNVVNDDETQRSRNRRSLELPRLIRRDNVAESIKLRNEQNKINMKNTTLLEPSPLRSRSAIAQDSTAVLTCDINMKALRNSESLRALVERVIDNDAKRRELRYKQIEKNILLTQMIMERVNDDCLAEIFMYVPAWERQKIALVCEKWKRALEYSWFNVKKLELTYWRYHYFPNCIRNCRTSDQIFNFLKSLLNKCGRYLETLDLTAYGDRCNLVPIINDYCPNLEKLRLRFISIDDTMLFNAFTRLSKLKSLTIIFENMKGKSIPVTLINSLRNVADTLTELNLLNFVNHLDESCDFPEEFDCVIRELKVMKKFEVAGIRDSKNLFEYFNNNEMSFYLNHNEYLEKPPYLGDSFEKIWKLDLTSYFIKDDTLYTIANTIETLQVLTINCAQITDDGIVALSKMDDLQFIFLNGHSNITDSSIKLLKNIVKLSLPRSNKITDVSVTELVENSPKIECLLLHNTTSVTGNFIKEAAEISNRRKQILKITIHSLIPDVKQYESPYFKIYIIENKEK